MAKNRGITVVSPMYGDMDKTNRMIFSVITQFVNKENPYKIHLVLVDDYIEKRGENDESYYSYYTSEEFKKFYDPDFVYIEIIKNSEHKYQGESREIGFLAGKYRYFVLVDCDDMLAPNCCDRYLNIIDQTKYDAKQNKQPVLPIACIHGLLYSFDTHGYETNIPGHSIWVQGRCYNRDFIKKHDIHFPTGINSKQGEDYPFIKKLDYAIAHDQSYITIKIPYEEQKDCQATAFWFPNPDSLSRKDPHYSQHLAGWTMGSSNTIIEFYEQFNEENGFESEEDEFMKMEVLNMTIYSFYNLLDFLKEVASTDYKPLEEDWYALRDNVSKLRNRLKNVYWPEIVYSDVEDMLFNVKHHSDCHFTESWIGTFYDYMNNDDVEDLNELGILHMDYDAMIKYCESLEFDNAGHEIHSPQVKAWQERHNVKKN